MKVTEYVYARGHANVQATHNTTFQITKEPFVSARGDCVIVVASTKGAIDLSSEFKENARREKAQITVVIEVDDFKEVVKAQGSARLTFTHPNDLIVRKSSYVCGRTLAIKADKAACDLSRELVMKLRYPEQKVKVMLAVEAAT